MFRIADSAMNRKNLEIIMLQQLDELSDDLIALSDALLCHEYEV
jgi:hypothetical protein